jgi:hypothetical protein
VSAGPRAARRQEGRSLREVRVHLIGSYLANGALVAFLLALSACEKKKPPPVVTACVLTDDDGKVRQCFEYANDKSKETRAQECNEFEGFKKTHQDGACPAAGSVGACVPQVSRTKIVCYGKADKCKEDCVSQNGTFIPVK